MFKRIVKFVFGRTFHDRLFATRLTPQRVKQMAKAGIAEVIGRPVYCHTCGERLAKVLPVPRKGRIELWGIHARIVRVEFEDRASLRFTHVLAENCISLRRPDGS